MLEPGETVVPSGMVASETKVKPVVQVVGVGVGDTEEVGVSTIGVNNWGSGVVVGSISVGRALVGGRKRVGVDFGAQEVSNHRKTKINTEARLRNLRGSAFICPPNEKDDRLVVPLV